MTGKFEYPTDGLYFTKIQKLNLPHDDAVFSTTTLNLGVLPIHKVNEIPINAVFLPNLGMPLAQLPQVAYEYRKFDLPFFDRIARVSIGRFVP